MKIKDILNEGWFDGARIKEAIALLDRVQSMDPDGRGLLAKFIHLAAEQVSKATGLRPAAFVIGADVDKETARLMNEAALSAYRFAKECQEKSINAETEQENAKWKLLSFSFAFIMHVMRSHNTKEIVPIVQQIASLLRI